MNENIYVRLIVSETTWIRQEWVIVETFQDIHEVLDATILVLCDIRTVLCSISTLHLLSVLHHTIHLVLAVLQTSLDRHPTCRNAVCTSIEIVMWFDSGSLFLSCELAASIVFKDNVDGVGENISAVFAPDIDCSLQD